MTVLFTAEAERLFEGEYEDIRVEVCVDGAVLFYVIDEEGTGELSFTLSMTDLANINQFVARAIKAMEAAKTEVEGG